LIDFRAPPREAREVVPGFLWIDAEDFADYGGWWIDTQYVGFMGSAYLIAAGVCQPVADATTTVEVPRAGRYRLWVRAKNWHPAHAPGRFQVLLNGQAATRTLGAAPSAAWQWESAGEFDLPAGTLRLALHDLTGAYGRCDALVLTTDLNYTPPADVAAIAQERARLTGLSLQPRDAGTYDVVVVGAGPAGSCAAIAAARLGAKTALLHDRPVLGGNASLELGVPPQGGAFRHPNAREGGIMEEALRITVARNHTTISDALTELAAAETNLTVLLNERVFAAEMAAPGRIAAVRAVHTLDGRLCQARGRQFIDCTGDGWLGFYAGAEYRLGRESRAETGEKFAPEKADNVTMSGCVFGPHGMFFHTVERKRATPFVPPAWAAQLPPPEEFGREIQSATSGSWWLEHEGTVDDLNDPEFARDELIRIVFGYWDLIKNRWPGRRQLANRELTHVPIWNAKRETRRLLGDYVLTQQDAQSAPLFPDRIAYGGWSLDIHHPRGIHSGKAGPYEFDASTPLFSIPYRCLYSRNVTNLLFAGRDCSVTHVALGSIRVESTLATLGQAAGAAAALCVRHRVAPRDIYREHMPELQQLLLKNDQYILGLKNEDPADLARQATVTASSATTHQEFARDAVVPLRGMSHELTTARAVILPTGLDARLDSAWLLLTSTAAKPVPVTAHLCGTTALETFAAGKDIATATVTVNPGKKQWVKFDFNAQVSAPFFGVWLPPTPGLSWLLMGGAPDGAGRAHGGGADRPWTVQGAQYYAAATEPPRSFSGEAVASNVVDGVARTVGRDLHLWSSDPRQPLPQWIQLDLGAARQVNTIQVTFDTDMNMRWPAKPLAKQCVRDYEIACADGNGPWRTLVAVKDNFQRWRVHRFAPVSAQKIRLTVLATHGDPAARVFEVRVYNE
jgi:hypothetical protein